MKGFRINEGTLKLVQEKLTVLRDTTNSRSELLELSTLLKVLEKLTQIVEPAKPAWDCPQTFTDSLLKKYKKNFEEQYLGNWTKELIFGKEAQTSTSSLVGNRVRRSISSLDGISRQRVERGIPLPIGTVVQELLTGELIVDFKAYNKALSDPFRRDQLEFVE